MGKKIIYLDHAAASPVLPEVWEAIRPYFSERFWNPSAVYDLGTEIREKVEEARRRVAGLIGAEPEEIIFTSCGAEANNMAIKGLALAHEKKGKRILVSAIEHHSVLNSARFLERLGFEMALIPVDSRGRVTPEALQKMLTPDTVLVSIGHANNEIGTVQDLKPLVELTHQNGTFFHTDAVASVGQIPVEVRELGVDLLSLSGISLGAPKGVGALYVRKGVRIMPLIHGGIQERGWRAGTENVPAIIGLGVAAEIQKNRLPQKMKRLRKLRDRLVEGILERIPKTHYTGDPQNRLPGHASFCFEGLEGEALVFMLAAHGIYGNTGSACASKALKTSPVLKALGLPEVVAQGSLVLTLEEENTDEEVDRVLEVLPQVVARLRAMSPIWED
ncbi:cysteine desulfurase family protein [Thermosulfurimonas sp. F29]|uniref:cysteine desulfurase family protein n=1 Tax=Thermosulfurimonas sp. F29 TaxID=2867247 RepID=UPI001C8355CA|nr:cysteine desulfurase family protein [Thermosulfurimonas sp. F29]MBX6422612.1 cysteine desulfurase [Thermosulfurimonas sp. F29]